MAPTAPRNSPHDRALPRLTDRLLLGTSSHRVSPVCLGIAGTPETVLAAFDAGINFFFLSADLHWPAYEPLRRGLSMLSARGVKRSEWVLASASYPAQHELGTWAFYDVLQAAPWLERLDVLVIGASYARDFPSRRDVYRRSVDAGDYGASALGATFHDRAAARGAVEEGDVEVAYVRYNPSHAGAEVDLFPHVGDARTTTLYGFKSTGGYDPERGERCTDYYRFALSSPLDGILCSLADAAEVAELRVALEEGPLSDEESTRLRALTGYTARR